MGQQRCTPSGGSGANPFICLFRLLEAAHSLALGSTSLQSLPLLPHCFSELDSPASLLQGPCKSQ